MIANTEDIQDFCENMEMDIDAEKPTWKKLYANSKR
tara:strand:+ start:84803 stop:84910 length:108 start_codon:yes stop_codon:yes gene_type:complete